MTAGGPARSAAATDVASFQVGDRAELTRAITAELIDGFASVSGDYNPLHVDEDFALRTKFGRAVAHGMIAASCVSTVIGMQLPGPGALWLEQTFRWRAPLHIGDTVSVEVVVTHISRATRILSIGVEAKNQNGKRVMDGEGKVMLLESATGE